MPLDEAKAWAEAQRANRPFDDDVLAIAAGEAMHHGLTKLIQVCGEKSRVSTAEFKEESTDIDAAKTLLKFALDARKLLVATGKQASAAKGPKDLFDSAAGPGPWDLREAQ